MNTTRTMTAAKQALGSFSLQLMTSQLHGKPFFSFTQNNQQHLKLTTQRGKSCLHRCSNSATGLCYVSAVAVMPDTSHYGIRRECSFLFSMRPAPTVLVTESLIWLFVVTEKQWQNTSSTTPPPTHTYGRAPRAKITKVFVSLCLDKLHLE